MAFSSGPEWPLRFLPPQRPWSRRVLAGSAALHGLVFALACWVTRGGYQGPPSSPVVHTTRAYDLHYLVLTRPRPKTKPEHWTERAPARRQGKVAPELVAATPPSSIPDSGSRREPARSLLQIRELPPGRVAGIGQVIATAASGASRGRGILGILGFRVPGPDEIGPPRRGLDRVADLVTGAGSACPELRPPAALAHRELAVAVAFVVDTNGVVDRATLQVVESPGRPPSQQRFRSHIYVVAATVRPDRSRIDPAGYDSVVTHEVASHVADLVFRPALKEGRKVRSTVLISCQTSPSD
jgi:hypothetical protein